MDRIYTNEKSKLTTLQKEIKACENIIKAQEEEISQIKVSAKEPEAEGNMTIEKIKTSIENTIGKRLSGLESKVEELVTKSNSETNKVGTISYAQATKKQIEAQSEKIERVIMKEKHEDRWIKLTSCNLIIHGVDETIEETKQKCKKGDKKFVERKVLKEMGLEMTLAKINKLKTVDPFFDILRRVVPPSTSQPKILTLTKES